MFVKGNKSTSKGTATGFIEAEGQYCYSLRYTCDPALKSRVFVM